MFSWSSTFVIDPVWHGTELLKAGLSTVTGLETVVATWHSCYSQVIGTCLAEQGVTFWMKWPHTISHKWPELCTSIWLQIVEMGCLPQFSKHQHCSTISVSLSVDDGKSPAIARGLPSSSPCLLSGWPGTTPLRTAVKWGAWAQFSLRSLWFLCSGICICIYVCYGAVDKECHLPCQ